MGGRCAGTRSRGAFNNHNAGKLGVTLNLREPRAKELLRELVAVSDAVTENFAAGVMERLGFGYESLREIRNDIVYVSNNGFEQRDPTALSSHGAQSPRRYRDSLILQVYLISRQQAGGIRLWITLVATTWQQQYLWVCCIDNAQAKVNGWTSPVLKQPAH